MLVNDTGNADLDGELVEATYSSDGMGHTGTPGDYAVSFEGLNEDYVVTPATEETFDEITITAWVNGIQTGDWAGLVVSRDGAQPIGLDYHAFDGTLSYIWNDNSGETWGFISDMVVPEDEWTFVALTVTEDAATLYSGVKGDELDSAVNEIDHFSQDNLTEWRWAEDDCCGEGRNFAGLMDDVSIWNEALSEEQLAMLHAGTSTPLSLAGIGPVGDPGDFDGDGVLGPADIDLLSTAVRDGGDVGVYDLDGNGTLDADDRVFWVESLAKTWFGDANFDGEFNSSDLVATFTVGEYEDGVDDNSTWSEGDWTGTPISIVAISWSRLAVAVSKWDRVEPLRPRSQNLRLASVC